MDCDRYEVLYRVVRITNSATLEFPQICKDILRFLARRFDLDSLSLLLLDSRHKTFSRVIHHGGPGLFLPCSRPPEPGPELQALARRRPLPRDDGWVLPLLHGRRRLGILTLSTARGRPLAAGDLEVFRAAGEEIGRLARLEQLRRQEKQQLLQLALLAEFGRALNQVRGLDDLSAVCWLLLHEGQATGVVLRPLFDEADNAPLVFCQPAESGFADLLAKAETRHFAAALAAGAPICRRAPRGGRLPAGTLPAAMATIPLLLQGQALGVLTLFGREEGLFFAGGRGGRRFLTALGAHLVEAIERLQSQKRLDRLALENDRKLQETSLLYRISRAIHSTLRLNELIHLLLSAAVAPGGGGFERAMLFTLNERTQTLQGMLCVTRETSAFVLPSDEGGQAWERPVVTEQARQRQREAECCRRVMKQRLPLDPEDNALAMAISKERVIFVPDPGRQPSSAGALAAELQLGAFACAPLLGRHRPLGVLLVDNQASGEPFSPHRQRFLELFAAQAGSAMENSMLLHRLETAHEDLRETQERLIQGEKMAVLGEMAASLAHELRNPLVPLGGFAERLRRMFPAESREGEYAEIISREARRMEEMLSNILSFSKKQMLCFTECRIAEVIAEAIDLERDALDRSSIEVITEIATDLPCVQCDDKKLRQVLINLITNARQAMPDGGTLTVRGYRSILRGEEAVAVEIEDSGGGISPEVLHNIFNPFFTTKEKGTGLGLSISHRIIEHHRGEIEVKNHARGVVFTVRLPAHSAEVSRIDKPARFR